MLNRGHAASGEAVAVAQAINEVHDRRLEIAGQNEVAVGRVSLAVAVHGSARRDERLREHLAAKNAARSEIAILPAIDIDLERLEVEQRKKRFGGC